MVNSCLLLLLLINWELAFEYIGEGISKSRIIALSVQKEAAIAASFGNFKKYLGKR
ncbi:MAG: hypothetical protein V7K41_02090 [Nostoc sp.]|uniref:hypothetical protein n=1 Tax=Nostoc sp. TaxID=1180 RepID=UPI002FFA5996